MKVEWYGTSKHGNAIEILDRIIFDFYTGLPHVVLVVFALIYMQHKHLKFEAYEKFRSIKMFTTKCLNE